MTRIPDILEGYEVWAGDEPFENHAGPFFMKHDAEHGKHLSLSPSHASMNGGGFLHGGMLMSFADYALLRLPLM